LYVDGDDLTSLKAEYMSFLENEGNGIDAKHRHPTNDEGMVVRTTRAALKDSDFPITKNIFGSKFMEDVLKRYYAPHKCKLNEDIFITHEKPCETPILPWHFDRIQSLKFFIYIKDVTINDGAFEYAPGTHNEGHYRANYHLATGITLEQLPNDIPADEIINPVPIEGQAGDLIIFDSDGFHRGGTVSPDGERMVMRGHSHPQGNGGFGKARVFSKNWFVGSCLNVAKLFKDDYSRVLGDMVKSQADSRLNK